MKKYWVILFAFILSSISIADEIQILGSWETVLSFPYSIMAWFDEDVYSEYIVTNATETYRNYLADHFQEEPVFKKIFLGPENLGFIVFFRNPDMNVTMLFADPGIGNGSLRLSAVTGEEFWIDHVYIAEDMILVRVFTHEYATNNGFYLIMKNTN